MQLEFQLNVLSKTGFTAFFTLFSQFLQQKTKILPVILLDWPEGWFMATTSLSYNVTDGKKKLRVVQHTIKNDINNNHVFK